MAAHWTLKGSKDSREIEIQIETVGREAYRTDAETGFKFSSTVLMKRGFMAVVAKNRR